MPNHFIPPRFKFFDFIGFVHGCAETVNSPRENLRYRAPQRGALVRGNYRLWRTPRHARDPRPHYPNIRLDTSIHEQTATKQHRLAVVVQSTEGQNHNFAQKLLRVYQHHVPKISVRSPRPGIHPEHIPQIPLVAKIHNVEKIRVRQLCPSKIAVKSL
ncbi:phosphate regulon sensor protein phoR [Striga asiatica]|uniref:Phosphate regulon sensor protein phoR n=1 Tax=Striga asiatica TaxID=4170 RepID=A0A5A7QTB5_STRAF|nr:phosphate regulon sensor protein phoR [Striga asiatica]